MRSFFVVEGDYQISRMMESVAVETPSIEKADIVVFPGGADVDPALYGAKKHPYTSSSQRRMDNFKKAFGRAQKAQLHVGICGGGQFLNVIHGGEMYQDVDNHAVPRGHTAYYIDESDRFPSRFSVTSTHHQMMKPNLTRGELWGWAFEATYRDLEYLRQDTLYPDGVDKSPRRDTEIVFYKGEVPALCFQPHPEYADKECRELFFICLERALKRSQ